jgi:Cys-tRNA synthase (O-phospho-L-seryl-tRNA:Cys-tRNA synthase)
LRWGDDKKSAKTRSWENAIKKARKLEQELELKEMGIEPPKPQDHDKIEEAVDLYVADFMLLAAIRLAA